MTMQCRWWIKAAVDFVFENFGVDVRIKFPQNDIVIFGVKYTCITLNRLTNIALLYENYKTKAYLLCS